MTSFVKQPVPDAETAASPLGDFRFNHDCVAETRRSRERCAHIDHRDPDDPVSFQHLRFGYSGLLEQGGRAVVKKGKVSGKIDNPSRIAITPLNLDCLAADNFL